MDRRTPLAADVDAAVRRVEAEKARLRAAEAAARRSIGLRALNAVLNASAPPPPVAIPSTTPARSPFASPGGDAFSPSTMSPARVRLLAAGAVLEQVVGSPPPPPPSPVAAAAAAAATAAATAAAATAASIASAQAAAGAAMMVGGGSPSSTPTRVPSSPGFHRDPAAHSNGWHRLAGVTASPSSPPTRFQGDWRAHGGGSSGGGDGQSLGHDHTPSLGVMASGGGGEGRELDDGADEHDPVPWAGVVPLRHELPLLPPSTTTTTPVPMPITRTATPASLPPPTSLHADAWEHTPHPHAARDARGSGVGPAEEEIVEAPPPPHGVSFAVRMGQRSPPVRVGDGGGGVALPPPMPTPSAWFHAAPTPPARPPSSMVSGGSKAVARRPLVPGGGINNVRRIINALRDVCLAGGSRRKELEAALLAVDRASEAMGDRPGCDRFLILLASPDALAYRGLYACTATGGGGDAGHAVKVHGHGPAELRWGGGSGDREGGGTVMTGCWKYSTGGRRWEKMHTNTVGLTTDAVTVKAHATASGTTMGAY